MILEITQSQAPEIPHRFPWISPGAFEESLQVVRMDDNTTWQGASAIEALLAILPRGRLVSWMFHIPLMRHAIERLYRTFARNRHRLGCQDHCRNR